MTYVQPAPTMRLPMIGICGERRLPASGISLFRKGGLLVFWLNSFTAAVISAGCFTVTAASRLTGHLRR